MILCDYCGKPARYVDSAIVYHGVSYGMIWYCPNCKAWVGCHKGTNKPLGRLADGQLRFWKRRAHAAFDPVWRGKSRFTRRAAYEWLADEMGLSAEKTHIGMFDIAQCRRCIEICRNRNGGIAHEE